MISNENSKIIYSGDGTTTTFPYNFYIFQDSDIVVLLRDKNTGAETTQTLNSDYTVTGAGNESGGNVVFTSAPSSDYYVVIYREVELTQETDYVENDKFPADTHERALDKLTMITQQLDEKVSRAVLQPITQDTSIEFPIISSSSSGKYLTNDGSSLSWGSITATNYNGSIARGNDADKSSNPTAGDVYYATDTGIMYVCFTNGSWTAYYSDTVRLTTDQTIEGTKNFKSLTTRFGDGSLSGDINIDIINSVGQGEIRFSSSGWFGFRNGGSGGHQIQIKSDGTVSLPYQTPSSSDDVVTKGYVDGLPILYAWACYDGVTQTIIASYGVSSVTYNSTGKYTINFSTAMSDTNYAVVATQQGATSSNLNINSCYANKTSSSVEVWVYQDTNLIDGQVSVMIIR